MGREATRLHFSVVVSAMDNFPLPKLPTAPLVVYVVSTTGQGEDSLFLLGLATAGGHTGVARLLLEAGHTRCGPGRPAPLHGCIELAVASRQSQLIALIGSYSEKLALKDEL